MTSVKAPTMNAIVEAEPDSELHVSFFRNGQLV
jgi:hypothetical protein